MTYGYLLVAKPRDFTQSRETQSTVRERVDGEARNLEPAPPAVGTAEHPYAVSAYIVIQRRRTHRGMK
jgi:hypothetical protein